MRKTVDAKPRCVRIGFRWFAAALLAGVIALGSYTLWKSEKSERSGGQMSDNQPEQAPAAPSSVEPNPAVTAPKLVKVDRSGRPLERDTVKVPEQNP